MRGDGGVAGEGRVVGFHSWSKCTMPLMDINSDWMYASSGLCINLYYLFIYLCGSHLGVTCNYYI